MKKLLCLFLCVLLLAGCRADKPYTTGVYNWDTDKLPYSQEEIYAQLFDINNTVRLNLRMSDEELAKMQADHEAYTSRGSKSPIYRKADLEVSITTAADSYTYLIPEVGVRMKGNTSRTDFYSSSEGIYNIIHLKLSFQETFDEESYYGAAALSWKDDASRNARKDRTFATLEKLDLRWNRCDDSTYLKEYYAYAMYRDMGVLAPHTNLCSFDWAGVHMGVFTINEPIDKIYLEKYLPKAAQGGDLYKLGWAGNQNASFLSTDSIGIENEDEGAFFAYDLKTNKKASDHSALTSLIENLNDGDVTKEEFESLVDVDYFLTYAAVSYLLGNPDDLRANYNNCYIYFRPDTGKMIVIPYDYDRCLGITAHWNPTHSGVTDDNPFTTELLAVDRYDGNANRTQQNPLYIYSVDEGGYFIQEYALQLRRVADSTWFDTETFRQLYTIAYRHYAGSVTPGKTFRNTQRLSQSFSLDRTSDFGSNGNISFDEYVQAKLETLDRYLAETDQYDTGVPKESPTYYIRSDRNGWESDEAWAMENWGGVYSYKVESAQTISLKVYNQKTGTWYGSECIAEGCNVTFTTNDHTNIILPAGTYRITFDPKTNIITLTGPAQ